MNLRHSKTAAIIPQGGGVWMSAMIEVCSRSPAVRDDIDDLRRRYFGKGAVADLTVSDHTRKRHVEAILGLFRYRLRALDERLPLESHARQAAGISSRTVSVLRELVDLLRRERIVLPGYRRNNREERALWELNGITRALYLLDYIDSPVLRCNAQ